MRFIFSALLILIYFQTFSQELQINGFTVLDTDSIYNIKKPIFIDYKPKHIAIDFTDSSNANVECRLLNSENEKWINLHSRRYMTYANLFGGDYEFQVKNVTSKQIKTIKFSIEPAFWQKLWFIPSIFLYIIFLISLIIYIFFNYRFRQQTKLQRVRNDIASDLHDDVGATLSSISFFGEMMRSKILKNAPAEEVLPLLEKVISTSKETIETMRGVVWTINPNNDNAIDFFQKLQSFGREMLAAKNITFNFQTEGFEKEKLPLDIQRNLFLFYKETINNIAKHSKATQVEVNIKSLSTKGEGFRVRLDSSDNGIGFNSADLYEGHGLKSLRKRADELEGKLEIKSAEGQGTSITLSFTLP